MNFSEETNALKTDLQTRLDVPAPSDGVESGPLDSESTTQSTIRHRRFGFTIGKIHLLVPQGLFCELLIDVQISPLPNSPSHVEGLTNLRGNIIPIYSIATELGQVKSNAKYAYLLGNPQDGAALRVDNKPELVDLTDINPAQLSDDELPETLRSCVDSSFKVKGIHWYSLNHEQLFTKLAIPR